MIEGKGDKDRYALLTPSLLEALDQAQQNRTIPNYLQAAPPAWRTRRQTLLAHNWVVYAKPPPGGLAQVLD